MILLPVIIDFDFEAKRLSDPASSSFSESPPNVPAGDCLPAHTRYDLRLERLVRLLTLFRLVRLVTLFRLLIYQGLFCHDQVGSGIFLAFFNL